MGGVVLGSGTRSLLVGQKGCRLPFLVAVIEACKQGLLVAHPQKLVLYCGGVQDVILTVGELERVGC